MYLIDGHNLIPNVPGLSLRQIDDEMRLVELLQEYARVRGKAIEVFFDDAPPGQTGPRSFGMVRAHFSTASSTADAAIRSRLAKLGKRAREASVVTSDRQVQTAAREVGAAVISADTFARDLLAAQGAEPSARKGKASAGRKARSKPPEGPAVSPGELEEWLRLFGAGDPNNPGKKPRG